MRTFQKISSEIIHSNPWWQYKHDRYQLSGNQETDYFYGETRGSAIVIPVTEDGKLVLIRQYRYLSSRDSIEFPCGGSLECETSLDTAKRELLEETCFITGNLIKIAEFEPHNGLFKDRTSLFVDTELGEQQNLIQDESEYIEVIFRRIDEFEAMIKQGEIYDGQTLAAWAIAREYIKQMS
jgi:ADP-ribose pyrophosphatase